MAVKTLNENYQRNIDILEENLKRGMTASQALGVIDNWRSQFEKANMFGKAERDFINGALEKVEKKTHIGVKFMGDL